MEAFERRGDVDRALAILNDALKKRPTDGLVLSALKSICSEDPTPYLQALQRALAHDSDPAGRDRWALELAMTASEHADLALVEHALDQISPAATDSMEALALRQWCEQRRRAVDTATSAQGPAQADLTHAADDGDASDRTDPTLVTDAVTQATRPTDDDHLEALDALLTRTEDDPDLEAIRAHADALVGHEDSARALADLADGLSPSDARRRPLVDALLAARAAQHLTPHPPGPRRRTPGSQPALPHPRRPLTPAARAAVGAGRAPSSDAATPAGPAGGALAARRRRGWVTSPGRPLGVGLRPRRVS